MEHEEIKVSIWAGLAIAFGMVSVMKYVGFRLKKDSTPFDPVYWVKDNWAEYPVHLFLSWLVFFFDHDFINAINYLLSKSGTGWEMIHFDNSSFYFVIVPVALTLASYKWLRKKSPKVND